VAWEFNDGISRINDDLGGALRAVGIEKDHGVDYTLYASKLFKSLPAPLLLNAGVRATKAAHIGLLGFTHDYKYVFEGNAVLFSPAISRSPPNTGRNRTSTSHRQPRESRGGLVDLRRRLRRQ